MDNMEQSKYDGYVNALKVSIETGREKGILKTMDDEVIHFRAFVGGLKTGGVDANTDSFQGVSALAFEYAGGQTPFGPFKYAKRRNHKTESADAPANTENQ